MPITVSLLVCLHIPSGWVFFCCVTVLSEVVACSLVRQLAVWPSSGRAVQDPAFSITVCPFEFHALARADSCILGTQSRNSLGPTSRITELTECHWHGFDRPFW
ncbi:hypothetical protein BGY98DRAFT_64429 [Russula aff. rugulosa BPL654]|nr:hypothetical protein BGY98DRAFT_64429 [Russula aff. rugulosa BPL654]